MPWLKFVGSLGAGAGGSHPRDPAPQNRSILLSWNGQLKRRRVGYRNCHSVALVSGDNDGVLGVVVLMVLQIVAGLVSALLSISRLTPNLDGPEGTYQK